MEKNVVVVDEQGNEYGATYPKRAKGLVKNGRARFIDEHKICLACPPNEYLEDKEMSDNKNAITQEPVVEQTQDIGMGYVFAEIRALREQTEYLNEALKMLQSVASEGPGDIGAQQKARGIADVVQCRETTNQQLLRFYEKVYDDLKQRENQRKTEKIKLVKDIWLSYLEAVDDVLVEDDRPAVAKDVLSRLETLCANVMEDTI